MLGIALVFACTLMVVAVGSWHKAAYPESFAGMGAKFARTAPEPPKPNNQYEILCYPNFYVVKDGARTIKTIKVGEDKVLDNLVEEDNR